MTTATRRRLHLTSETFDPRPWVESAARQAEYGRPYRPGPWEDEPDQQRWVDSATGYPCMIKRSPFSGCLCGYVCVPRGHPAHGVYYEDLEVHGGVTFADTWFDEGDWWLGFDTAHAFDVMPGVPGMMMGGMFPDMEYRDLAYVIAEVESLADQLALLA